jgi:hypothetical protein
MWRLVAFRLYMLMNEYRHELESVVKSKLFKVRSHRWDRVYVTFVQRSPLYSYYNMLIVFACVHGYLDSILLRLVKFLEYTLMVYDVIVVSHLLKSSYHVLYWEMYSLLRLSGVSSCLMLMLCMQLGCHVSLFFSASNLSLVGYWFFDLVVVEFYCFYHHCQVYFCC